MSTKPKQHQKADLTPRNYLTREAKRNITRQDIITARHYAFRTWPVGNATSVDR